MCSVIDPLAQESLQKQNMFQNSESVIISATTGQSSPIDTMEEELLCDNIASKVAATSDERVTVVSSGHDAEPNLHSSSVEIVFDVNDPVGQVAKGHPTDHQAVIEEVENTPPLSTEQIRHCGSITSTHYYHQSAQHHHHYHHLHHLHHHHHYQTSNYESHLFVDGDSVHSDSEDNLPLSPSMTPPIVMSPPSSAGGSPLAPDTSALTDTTIIVPSEHCDPSDATISLVDIDDIVLDSCHQTIILNDERDAANNQSPATINTSNSTSTSYCDNSSATASTLLMKGQRTSKVYNSHHHHHRFHHHRYSPYSSSGHHRGHAKLDSPSHHVLRPINHDQQPNSESSKKSKPRDFGDSQSIGQHGVTNSENQTALSTSCECASCDRTMTSSADHQTTTPAANEASTVVGTDNGNETDGAQPLHIDTNLANSQCAAAQAESYHNKTHLAQQILSVIRNDDFEKFLSILNRSKPDLNVFVNGQTALHYCLLLGRDVSWCKQLVLNGANPNLSNQDGWHPLHLAAFKGLKDNLNYLISCNNNHHHNETIKSAQ